MSVITTAGASRTIYAAGTTWTKYRVQNLATDAIALGPITTGITYTATRSKATPTFSIAAGDYEIQWDDGSGAWAATEDLTLEAVGVTVNTSYSTTGGFVAS